MTTPSFVARDATDLLALVPIVIGFHPEESVVMLTFGSPSGAFHARVDLPRDPAEQRQVTDMLVHAAVSNAVETAAVLVYSDDAALAGSQALLVLDGLLERGVAVIDLIRVERERFYVIGEDDAGTAYDLSTHPFTARRVFDGQRVHRNRAELAASLRGEDPEGDAQVLAAAHAHADRIAREGRSTSVAAVAAVEARWAQRRIRRFVGRPAALDAEEAGRMLVLVSLVPVRDAAWSEMDRPSAQWHVPLWLDLVRRAPRDLVPGAAGLLGFAAWLAGDGALAWCAVDRCLEADPDYSLAHRISDLLTGAVPPDAWEPVPEADLPVFADAGGLWAS